MKAHFIVPTLALVLSPALVSALKPLPTFPDITPGSSYAHAVRWAAGAGVFQGMPDGLFHPDKTVDRATALTLLMRFSGNEAVVGSGSFFADVPVDAWYRSAAEAGVSLNIVEGPPARKYFEPSRIVTLEEFLKMLAVSQEREIAKQPYGKETFLSPDTAAPDLWSAGYLRDAYARAVIEVDEKGLLNPSRPMTRGEIANLLWRNDRAGKGEHLQAIVTNAEGEIRRFFVHAEKKSFVKAGFAATRLRILSEAAVAADPQSRVTIGIGKVSTAFNFLLAAQQAGTQKSMVNVTGNVEKAKAVAAEFPKVVPFIDLARRVTELAGALETQAAALAR